MYSIAFFSKKCYNFFRDGEMTKIPHNERREKRNFALRKIYEKT